MSVPKLIHPKRPEQAVSVISNENKFGAQLLCVKIINVKVKGWDLETEDTRVFHLVIVKILISACCLVVHTHTNRGGVTTSKGTMCIHSIT